MATCGTEKLLGVKRRKMLAREDGEKNVLYDEKNDRSLCYAPPTLIAAGKKSL